jgi:hypothetical protein
LQSAASQAVLSIACGVAIIGFSLSVLFDVVTRQIGHPWLWLQELTSGCFVYRIFLGMALAARRNEHMYLSEIVQSMHGASRRNTEVFARLVVLAVAAWAIPGRYRAGIAGRLRADDLQPFFRTSRPEAQTRLALPIRRRSEGICAAADDPDHHFGWHLFGLVHANRSRIDRGRRHRFRADPAHQSPAHPQPSLPRDFANAGLLSRPLRRRLRSAGCSPTCAGPTWWPVGSSR